MTYKPQLASTSQEVIVETTIGFIKEAPALPVCGFNIYHKNRLIKPFWKVVAEGSAKGNGVVGVLEANFIEPAHDKQDFERSSLFIRLEARLKQMVADYWKSHCHFVGHQPPGFRSQNRQKDLVAKPPKQLLPIQRDTGLPANLLEEVHLGQHIPGLPANSCQYTSGGQLGRDAQTSLTAEQPIGFADGSADVMLEDGSGFISIDQLCEANVQLFLRCIRCCQSQGECLIGLASHVVHEY